MTSSFLGMKNRTFGGMVSVVSGVLNYRNKFIAKMAPVFYECIKKRNHQLLTKWLTIETLWNLCATSLSMTVNYSIEN